MMQAVAVILAVTLLGAGANQGGAGSQKPVGVGVYAYQDSSGKRYGGTYDISEDDLSDAFAQYAPRFTDGSGFPGGFPQGFPFSGDFFPEFLKNLESNLREAFPGNQVNQRAAFKSVNNAFDSTFAHGGGGGGGGGADYYNIAQQYGGMNNGGGGGGDIGGFQHPGGNTAYAAGSIGPQGTRQIASISPGNANQPNVDISSRPSGGDGGFYSVSSSSYASSSDVGGKKTENRGAKTVVNDNGNVKKYEVHS